MKKYAFLFVFLLVFLPALRGEGKDLMVRVLLARSREGISLTSSSGLLVRVGKRTFSIAPGRSLAYLPGKGGVLWKEKNIEAPVFEVIPRGDRILVGQRPYRGQIELRRKGGMVEVVNILSLEDYLKGTIKLEVSPSWPEEALKAHIIVARTYVVKNLGRHKEEGFDFCNGVHCQRYGGVFAEDPRTNDLIEQTRGIILTYRGQPALVVFHSESGGYTDSAKNVWGKDVPYLVEVPSPWEEGAPHAFWEVTLSCREIEEALKGHGYIQSSVVGLECRKSPISNRVVSVLVHTDCGSVELTGNQFREAIGYDRLPSTFFDLLGSAPQGVQEIESPPSEEKRGEAGEMDYKAWMEKDWNLDDIITFLKLREKERERKKGRPASMPPRDTVSPPSQVLDGIMTFTFRGRGWGHGVGLSQWGAVGMAKTGADFAEILHYYFPGCDLGRMVIR
jgi:stage II sporulation protein D